ncbi:mannose-6-phosphate isomerase, class I [Corynebacterium sp. Q4381]|uniref:mannose-6-phosphate isomerase, class I n=1 Tax=Corynebacterium sp. Marseille-Q4381 TaxID=3121597 RepID=UPI002FE5D435
MEYLEPALRTYPWGSRTMLAELRGTESPAPTPEAELWFGAHPAAPSTVGGRSLHDVIEEDPVAALGARVADASGGELPFLVKLLAAGEPLSIQAHPSKAQAVEGFERENEQGIALDDPRRNYKDANHKPELIVALTPFRALAGFRPTHLTRELFDVLGPLERYSALLSGDDPQESLRAVFTTLISLPAGLRVALLGGVEVSARELIAGGAADWMFEVAETFLQLSERYPGDVGALVALMLNHVTLAPGEALFLGAGQPHAYLHGLGVEVMANSDNVLRGGLTSKHVDVPELARVLDFTALSDPRVAAAEVESGCEYQLPIDEFRVSRHPLAGGATLAVDNDGPAVVLCTAGRIRLGGLEIAPGAAVWVPASAEACVVELAGQEPAEVFLVRV